MNKLSRIVGIWARVLGYAGFLAARPRHTLVVARGMRAPGFHVGEYIKLQRLAPALNLDEYGTILDVGANRGQLSLTARFLHPGDVRIVAVEPLAACADDLDRAIELTGGNGRVIRAVANDETGGGVEFYESAQDKSSSMLEMSDAHRRDFPWTTPARVVTVDQIRLDDAIDVAELRGKVLLKLDVQGAELAALRGGAVLLKSVDAAIVEVDFDEHYAEQATPNQIIAHLDDAGFDLAGVGELLERRSDGGVVEADLLFLQR